MIEREPLGVHEAESVEPNRRRGDRRRGDRRRPHVRIAAVGDIHVSAESAGALRPGFARANEEADVLLLAGDLTRRGTTAEMRAVANELADVRIPILTVLGNHDFEADETGEGCAILREHGIHVLDGDAFEIDGRVGIAGARGFVGGFGRRRLTSFGEPAIKQFVAACTEEVHKLEQALQQLTTPARVVLLHYAPIEQTIVGEPEQIYPFLGTDRLAEPLERYGVSVCFHGHAHRGTFQGQTLGGVPVFNVAHEVVTKNGAGSLYFLYDLVLPAEEGADEEAGAGVGGGEA